MPTASSSSLPALAREHVPLLVALSSTALVLVRVAWVAGFDETTAYALLSQGSALAVIGGALLDLVPIGLAAAWTTMIVLVVRRGVLRSRFIGPVVLFGLFVTLEVPLDAFATIAGTAAIVAISRWPFRRMGHKPDFSWPEYVGGFVAAAALTALLGGDRPWFPAEAVTIAPDETVVGYVLDTDDHVAVLLIHRPRVLRHVETGAIRTRKICSVDPGGFFYHAPRLVDVLRGESRPRAPACPQP